MLRHLLFVCFLIFTGLGFWVSFLPLDTNCTKQWISLWVLKHEHRVLTVFAPVTLAFPALPNPSSLTPTLLFRRLLYQTPNAIFVFLSLSFLCHLSQWSLLPFSYKWQTFIPFYFIFNGWIMPHCVCMTHFLFYSSIDMHLGRVYGIATANGRHSEQECADVAIVYCHWFLWVYIYLGAVWLDHMVVSILLSSFSFLLMNHHTELKAVRLICNPCQCWKRFLFPQYSRQSFVLLFSWGQSPLTGVSWNLSVVLIDVFFTDADILHNLYCPGGFLHLESVQFIFPFICYVITLVFHVWVQYGF